VHKTITHKVFLSKDGTTRVIGPQTNLLPKALMGTISTQGQAQQPQQSLIRLTPGTATNTATAVTPQKLQIITGPDGIYQVRGLLSNQHLVQLPGGKIQVINTTPANPGQPITPSAPTILKTMSGTPLTSKSALMAGARVTTTPPITQTVTLAQQVQTVQQPAQTLTAVSTSGPTVKVKILLDYACFFRLKTFVSK
jgi:hypothetical protein